MRAREGRADPARLVSGPTRSGRLGGAAAASEVPEGHRIDPEDALAAVGRLTEAEHRGDAAERAVTARILTRECDLKTALSVLDLARTLERATDQLARFGHLLREHVLADLSFHMKGRPQMQMWTAWW